ncbi:MAG: imidazole glycerol phosphate synthase subunit HisH [Polyangiaceae bacterium]
MKALCFDYGAGNLHSLGRALASIGVEATVTTDLTYSLATANLLILPGVGAFGAAAGRLAPWKKNVHDALASGLPAIGICLGMQLLFDSSEEGAGEGIGLIAGKVTKLRARRVPHIGWTDVSGASRAGFPSVAGFMYFAHSYACRPNLEAEDDSLVTAWATHEDDRFAAIVRKNNAIGIQFHPEKSSRAGVDWLASAVKAVTT